MLHENMNACYPTPTATDCLEQQPLTVRLDRERDYLEKRLAKVNAAINALDSNPEFAGLLQLVQDVT